MTKRKIILGVAVSLDGYIEGPQGEFDWCFTDQDYGLADFFTRIDTIFMGRKSYELVMRMERESGENPYKNMHTVVFSNTLKTVEGNASMCSGDIVSQIRAMQQQPGKDIWLFGGAELTTTFVNHELVDELWLSIHPILLGSGKPLFVGVDGRKKLRLTQHQVYDTGLVSVRYEQVPSN